MKCSCQDPRHPKNGCNLDSYEEQGDLCLICYQDCRFLKRNKGLKITECKHKFTQLLEKPIIVDLDNLDNSQIKQAKKFMDNGRIIKGKTVYVICRLCGKEISSSEVHNFV
jgi:hypothetical protein